VRVLQLTHPFMHGADVLALQKVLHHNPYGVFFKFAQDGQFGPLTAHAVSVAKWHIGYAATEVKPLAGSMLMAFLTGQKQLTPQMQARRNDRQKKPVPRPPKPPLSMGHLALNWALQHVGQHEEPPGSNSCFATKEWGHGAMPWCDVFVSLSYIHAGSKSFSSHAQRWQYVPAMLQAARNHQDGLHCISFSELQPGDIIVHGPGAYHTTLHDRLVSVSNRVEWDVGGNEGNYGYVYHDLHDASLADAFIRVER